MGLVLQAVIMAVYQKTKPYNPAIQVQAMRARYPQFTSKKTMEGDIVFTGKLQVKSELPVYTVKVVYRGDDRPRIFILDPLPVPGAPHIFPGSGSLCLYHKDNYKWSESKLIAHEIMGWTAGWIYFYEYWLQNNHEWIGPEVPHGL
jgi:hypothetical protein